MQKVVCLIFEFVVDSFWRVGCPRKCSCSRSGCEILLRLPQSNALGFAYVRIDGVRYMSVSGFQHEGEHRICKA